MTDDRFEFLINEPLGHAAYPFYASRSATSSSRPAPPAIKPWNTSANSPPPNKPTNPATPTPLKCASSTRPTNARTPRYEKETSQRRVPCLWMHRQTWLRVRLFLGRFKLDDV